MIKNKHLYMSRGLSRVNLARERLWTAVILQRGMLTISFCELEIEAFIFKMAAKFSRFHENRSYEVAEITRFYEDICHKTVSMKSCLEIWRCFCYEFPFLCPCRPEMQTFHILTMMSPQSRKQLWMLISLR